MKFWQLVSVMRVDSEREALKTVISSKPGWQEFAVWLETGRLWLTPKTGANWIMSCRRTWFSAHSPTRSGCVSCSMMAS
jgi:hypothetical protein